MRAFFSFFVLAAIAVPSVASAGDCGSYVISVVNGVPLASATKQGARDYARLMKALRASHHQMCGEVDTFTDYTTDFWKIWASAGLDAASLLRFEEPAVAEKIRKLYTPLTAEVKGGALWERTLLLFDVDPGDGRSHQFVVSFDGQRVMHIIADPEHWPGDGSGEKWLMSHHIDAVAKSFLAGVDLRYHGP